MMAAKRVAAKRYFWLIERDPLNHAVCGISGILDMLRYDHATVEPNPPRGFYLLASPGPPTVARWASFGVKVAYVPARATEDSPHELSRWASEQG